MQECGVAEITMSQFGIKEDELPGFAKEVRTSLPLAFDCDPMDLTVEDCEEIYRRSFK